MSQDSWAYVIITWAQTRHTMRFRILIMSVPRSTIVASCSSLLLKQIDSDLIIHIRPDGLWSRSLPMHASRWRHDTPRDFTVRRQGRSFSTPYDDIELRRRYFRCENITAARRHRAVNIIFKRVALYNIEGAFPSRIPVGIERRRRLVKSQDLVSFVLVDDIIRDYSICRG